MTTKTFTISPTAVAVPILSLIAIFLDIPPFVWHVKNRNLPAASLVFWILLPLSFDFINALIWPTDDTSKWWCGYGLCDVEVKFLLASTTGLPGSLAGIMRNLALILDTENTVLVQSLTQRRKKLVAEILLSFGFPIYMICIHYIVQPTRYYIFAIAGCVTSFDDSWPTVILVWIWPSLLCFMAAYYSMLVTVRMLKYRRDFSSILESSNSNLTKSRFKRLFFMSATMVLIVLPVELYTLYRSVSFPLIQYDWKAIHGSSWSEIIMVPTGGKVFYDHWIHIAIAFALFFFFGLGKDAIRMYRRWLSKVGFDAIFPLLREDSPASRTINTSARQGGFSSSTARSLFMRRKSDTSFTGTLKSQCDSVSTWLTTPSPMEPQKSFFPLQTVTENASSRLWPLPELPGDPHSHTDEVLMPAPPRRTALRMPYLGSFLAGLRSPAAARRMAADSRV